MIIEPDEGYWKNGRFTFEVTIPPEYNIKVVICINKELNMNILIATISDLSHKTLAS